MADVTAQQPGARSEVADRYPHPRRGPRLLGIIVLGLVAVIGLAWLVWAAWEHSRPAVSGEVHLWHIDSDSSVSFTLTVDRPDPSVPVSCRVIAQAENFETVGEKTITLGTTRASVVDITDHLRTLRRATSVSLSSCQERSG
jgi:hypothetical protein